MDSEIYFFLIDRLTNKLLLVQVLKQNDPMINFEKKRKKERKKDISIINCNEASETFVLCAFFSNFQIWCLVCPSSPATQLTCKYLIIMHVKCSVI